MAIRKGATDTYWWKVRSRVPVDDGKFLTVGFKAKFRRLDKNRVREILDKIERGDDDMDDSALIEEILIGWKDVIGLETEDGSAPSYENDEEREWVLGIVGIEAAVVRAWLESITPQGRVKN